MLVKKKKKKKKKIKRNLKHALYNTFQIAQITKKDFKTKIIIHYL